ncbi:MAG TPA: DUF397 domain-containing protein [Streptosporangiaceae bacterium]|nr:DUF397 domain-containing protein [Streptosporangiaceae bacterium]
MTSPYDWRKSSYSSPQANCVEVADNVPGVVAVRDSKNPDGPKLVFMPEDWDVFTRRVKAGEVDLP